MITDESWIGQDSHRFDFDNKDKKLVLGGVVLEGYPPSKETAMQMLYSTLLQMQFPESPA